jgi:two-component system, OmpR family, sensor histidine kinase SenX3
VDDTLATLVVAAAGAMLGVAAVLAWRLSEREQATIPPRPAPAVPDGVASVLTVLRSSAVLVDETDTVLKASAPAYALGLVRGDRVVPGDLAALIRAVRSTGEIREGELTLTRERSAMPVQVVARVAPLGSRLVLVLAEDRTRERRVESIRRDFVANVSHELKTPVGALNLLAEAIAEAAEDPEAVRRFAGRMQTESDRLNRLVQQIIELSRLQGDELIDEPAEVRIDGVIDAALDRSRTDAEAKGIELATRCDADLVVSGSGDQLLVAVSNLIENAVTYSPEGARVAVMAHRRHRIGMLGPAVEITVSDQGIGIPEAELDRIFERFYRLDPARSRDTGGTGLGLSIVKHVAASHGGDIVVWSEPGQGSSFTLRLPLADPEAETDDPSLATVSAEIAHQPHPRPDEGAGRPTMGGADVQSRRESAPQEEAQS